MNIKLLFTDRLRYRCLYSNCELGYYSNDYVLEKEIGSGKFGRVFKAINTKTFTVHAIKVLQKGVTHNIREVGNYLNFLRYDDFNKYFVDVHEMYRSDKRYYIVMDYYSSGSLLNGHLFEFVKPDQFIKIIRQLLLCMKYVHDKEITINDLKPENILYKYNQISDDYVVKFIDLGLYTKFGGLICLGTPLYYSPEVFGKDEQKYYDKKDVWALGLCIYKLMVGKDAQASMMYIETGKKKIIYLEDKFITWLTSVEHDLYEAFAKFNETHDIKYIDEQQMSIVNFVMKCLEKNPDVRLNCTELLQCELFSDF